MEIIMSLDKINIDLYKTGIALGNFDGVHIGHQTLIVNLVEICKKNNLKSIIYTFRDHPKRLTSNNETPKRIMSNDQKINIIKELGVDYLVFVEFDNFQRTLQPEKFIKNILKEKLKMNYAVVGFDYRFGYQAKGDIELLKCLKDKYSYELCVIDAIKIQNEIISSTTIRQLIHDGYISKANLYLGRPYSITGKVISGKGLGRKLGFPTANIAIEPDMLLPHPGVYFSKCIIDNKIYYSVTNVGFTPTIGTNLMSVEAHILNFNENIYGKQIQIQFFYKSRNEKRYEKIDDLIHQIHIDVQMTKRFFAI